MVATRTAMPTRARIRIREGSSRFAVFPAPDGRGKAAGTPPAGEKGPRVRRVLGLVLCCLAAVAAAPAATPEAPALAAVRVRGPQDARALASFDLAEARHGDEIDVVLWPGDAARLRDLGLAYRVVVPDLLAADAAVRAEDLAARASGTQTAYRHLQDYETQMRALAEQYPDRVRVLTLPEVTLEGRAVTGVEIAENVAADDGRPVAYIDGVHHAREWPAGELAMDFATELATRYRQDQRVTRLLQRARVIIVPVVNPDGFVASRETPVDGNENLGIVAGGQGAYWRKNRRAVLNVAAVNASVGAYGVDPNRNYAFFWGSGAYDSYASTSSDPTSQAYQGDAPFSEPETRNVRSIILGRNVTAALSIHTYGELILWPWGHVDDPSPDDAVFRALGGAMATSARYRGQQGIDLYPTTGTADDWFYASTGAIGFTMEAARAFHPTYTSTFPALYLRTRDALLRLAEGAAKSAWHSVITGRVVDGAGRPVAADLLIEKEFETPLSTTTDDGVPRLNGPSHPEAQSLRLGAGIDGTFEWHLPPSTRPIAQKPESYMLSIGERTMPITIARGETIDLGTIVL